MHSSRGLRDLSLSRARHAGLWMLLPALACACTDPQFPNDGGTDAAAPEGEDVADAALDPLRARWVGRYAARSFLYAIDGPLRPTAEELSIVEIKPRGDGLVLTQQPCLFSGGWSFFLEGNLHYEYPTPLEPLVADMILDGESFETKLATFTLGYDAEPPRACSAAESAPARSEQRWLSDTCTCPLEVDALPTSEEDCRVTDADRDGKPGVTMEVLITGSRLVYHALQKVYIRYSHGYRLGERLYANVESVAETTVLSCVQSSVTPGCTIGEATPCPPEYNKTEFITISDAYDCRRVIAERAGLFPGPLPPFPRACAIAP